MTREEYNELRYIRKMLRQCPPSYGCTCTIRTNASSSYKTSLHKLYCSMNMHPASIRTDKAMYDDHERIIYLYGRHHWGRDWKNGGRQCLKSWETLYTAEERKRLAEALK